MKRLYHYTCVGHVDSIMSEGRLRTTESNLSLKKEHAGPDVVWLTTDPDCVHGHGLEHPIPLPPSMIEIIDKTRIRIEVELPNARVHKWYDWAKRRKMDPEWMQIIIRAGKGGSGTWRVIEEPIPQERWVEIVDRKTGERIWSRE